jgi:Flp pilus assembly protein TadG
LPPRLVGTVEVLLVAAALTLPSALIADAVPWWRSGDLAGLVFTAAAVAVIGALTAVVVLGPWRRGALGPLGAVGGITAGIVGLDVLTGARLQLNGVAGYSALEGSRYAGLGTIGLGVFIAGILLIAGWLAQRLPRRWRPSVVAVIGGVGVVLVGSPYLGSDVGGAIALTAGVCVAAAISTGGFLTFVRLAWATLTGLAVTVCFALLDLARPTDDRGSLGRFLAAARDGTGGTVIHRTGAANGTALFSSPLTLVVFGSGILIVFALLRPWGGLKRLFGIYPAIRAALIGIPLAAVLAGFVDGAGFNVAGAAAATTVPLAALAALRVLNHADDRTGAVIAPAPAPASLTDSTSSTSLADSTSSTSLADSTSSASLGDLPDSAAGMPVVPGAGGMPEPVGVEVAPAVVPGGGSPPAEPDIPVPPVDLAAGPPAAAQQPRTRRSGPSRTVQHGSGGAAVGDPATTVPDGA